MKYIVTWLLFSCLAPTERKTIEFTDRDAAIRFCLMQKKIQRLQENWRSCQYIDSIKIDSTHESRR